MRKIFYEVKDDVRYTTDCPNELERKGSGCEDLKVGTDHCVDGRDNDCTFCEAHSHKHKWVECAYVEEVEVEWELTGDPKLIGIDSLLSAGASDAVLADYCKMFLVNPHCVSDVAWAKRTSACKSELEKLGFIRKVREPEIVPEVGEVWVFKDKYHHILMEKHGLPLHNLWNTWCFETKQVGEASLKIADSDWKRKQSSENVLHLIQIPVLNYNTEQA